MAVTGTANGATGSTNWTSPNPRSRCPPTSSPTSRAPAGANGQRTGEVALANAARAKEHDILSALDEGDADEFLSLSAWGATGEGEVGPADASELWLPAAR